jgi:hypothetical protein
LEDYDRKWCFGNVGVSWKVDDIAVYGTLRGPVDEKACSAIVFVAGSGPADHGWCSPLLPGKNGSASFVCPGLVPKVDGAKLKGSDEARMEWIRIFGGEPPTQPACDDRDLG